MTRTMRLDDSELIRIQLFDRRDTVKRRNNLIGDISERAAALEAMRLAEDFLLDSLHDDSYRLLVVWS